MIKGELEDLNMRIRNVDSDIEKLRALRIDFVQAQAAFNDTDNVAIDHKINQA